MAPSGIVTTMTVSFSTTPPSRPRAVLPTTDVAIAILSCRTCTYSVCSVLDSYAGFTENAVSNTTYTITGWQQRACYPGASHSLSLYGYPYTIITGTNMFHSSLMEARGVNPGNTQEWHLLSSCAAKRRESDHAKNR